MVDFKDRGLRNFILLGALCFGSFLLIVGAIYMIKDFAILYGAGVGAYETANFLLPLIHGNSTAAQILAQTSAQLTDLHKGILESYITLLVALIIMASAFIMLVRRNDKNNSAVRRYTMMHLAFTVVYILLFFIVISNFYADFQSVYIYIPYVGMFMCVVLDLYIEYKIRMPAPDAAGPRPMSSMSMDPNKPFSNIVAMQDQLFPAMSGHLRIVDKHFNSVALTNFHRLVDKNMSNFTKVSVLTSKEMMDTSFNSNLTDFKNELSDMGVGIEVKLMDDKDAVDQHERIMMDDRIAYKIPPFNIINKRSEHITKINFADANRRFQQLSSRAIKFENYAVKQARVDRPGVAPDMPAHHKPPEEP